MNGKIITPNKANKSKNILSILITLILGVILVTNSNKIVIITFQLIGATILIFGIYKTLRYFSMRKQFQVEDSNALLSGIMGITIGLLTIFLSSAIEISLRYLLGFFLVLNGISKIATSLTWKEKSHLFLSLLIEGTILLAFGLYSIFFQNAALMIIGLLLIASAIMDFITYLQLK